MTHICVDKLTTIVSDNDLSPGRRQAIIWNNSGILLIGHLWTNFSEILIEIHTFSLKKMRFKMSSAKWRWETIDYENNFPEIIPEEIYQHAYRYQFSIAASGNARCPTDQTLNNVLSWNFLRWKISWENRAMARQNCSNPRALARRALL